MKDFRASHHIYLAGLIFFLIITAQTLWSTIHGDGAVYAWMIREICQNTSSLLNHPLAWMREGFFAEHPYLFFLISAPISAVFGTGDIGIKIPNYLVGFISLWMVYKTSKLSNTSPWPGLLAGYVLITNPLYELMLRQPTLDPLAQLFSFLSLFILIYQESPALKKFFISGLLLGLAFLTKGLELLPNLAALFIVVCLIARKNNLNYAKVLICGISGLALPLIAWFAYDTIFWHQEWSHHYFASQIKSRFFGEQNTQTAMNLNYVKNLISKYFIQLALIAWGAYQSLKQKKSFSFFWWYTVTYIFFNVLAFSIIKKDSSQHMTGIFLLSSVLVGQYLYDIYLSIRHTRAQVTFDKILPYFHYVVGIGVLSMWVWFMTHENNKKDMWTFIKNQSSFFNQSENNLPVVLSDNVSDITGVYFTAQWYWPQSKLFFPLEAKHILSGQDVFLLTGKDENSFQIDRAQYNP